MNFTIDTQSKKITLNQSFTFSELEELKKFIGKGWEKWTLQQQVQYIEGNTTIIQTPIYPNPWRPYYSSPYWKVMCQGDNDSIFNINNTSSNTDAGFTLTSLLSHGAKGTTEG